MTSNTNSSDGPCIVLIGKVSPAVTVAQLGTWASLALCADTDPEIFFPAHDDPATEAKQICARCTVRPACLKFALENNERYGIWGGLNPAERDTLRRKLRQRKPQPQDGQGAA
jgi:WhiB family redox-sensing transcriptional regulator